MNTSLITNQIFDCNNGITIEQERKTSIANREKDSAAIKIQSLFRGRQVRKELDIKRLAPGLWNITCSKISLFIQTKELDEKSESISITSIDLDRFNIEVRGGGKSEELSLKSQKSFQNIFGNKAGAFINGGFFTTSKWYKGSRKPKDPIGLLKTAHYDKVEFNNQNKELAFKAPLVNTGSDKTPLVAKLCSRDYTPIDYFDEYGVLTVKNNQIKVLERSMTYECHIRSSTYALSAAPILVKNNEQVFHSELLQEKRFQWSEVKNRYKDKKGACPPGFLYHADQPNPRSAIGISQDGKRLLMVTTKGRGEKYKGFDLNELAQLMLALGSSQALNLDGGNSSVMGVKAENKAMQILKSSSSEKFISLPNYIVALQKSN